MCFFLSSTIIENVSAILSYIFFISLLAILLYSPILLIPTFSMKSIESWLMIESLFYPFYKKSTCLHILPVEF